LPIWHAVLVSFASFLRIATFVASVACAVLAAASLISGVAAMSDLRARVEALESCQ